jgi:hypothetical protein
MDELQTLREFRRDVDAAADDDPARERTMRAIRELIEREAPARVPRRRLRRRAVAVALAAAAIAGVVAVLPSRDSGSSLVDQALAAVGDGGVLHIVGEVATGREILDLNSGRATPVIQQEEIWFDGDRGLRRDVMRIGGVIVDDTLQTPEGGWTPGGVVYDCTWIAAHPVEATRKRVSCNASGDNGTTPHVVPRPKPTLDPGLAGFADSYRSALASGAAHEDGTGTVGGRAVDWLVFATDKGPERVALDGETHKPVLIDGPHGIRMSITAIETTDTANGQFTRPTADEIPVEPNFSRNEDLQPVGLDARSIAAAYNGAVWAGAQIAGIPLVTATLQRLSASYPGDTPTAVGTGLQLQYGTLDANGRRDYTKPFVTISEAPNPTLAASYKWFARGWDPAPGQLYLESMGGGMSIGLLRVDSLAVEIEASSEDLLTTAARALTPAS